jgi:hypothetical protein
MNPSGVRRYQKALLDFDSVELVTKGERGGGPGSLKMGPKMAAATDNKVRDRDAEID